MICCLVVHQGWYENSCHVIPTSSNWNKGIPIYPHHTLHVHVVTWHIHAEPQRPRTNPLIPPPAGPSRSPGTQHSEQVGGQGLSVGLQPTAHCMQLLPRGVSRRVTQYQQMASFSPSQLKSKLMCCLQTRRRWQHSLWCLWGSANSPKWYPSQVGEMTGTSACCGFSCISWLMWFIDRRHRYFPVPTVRALLHQWFST